MSLVFNVLILLGTILAAFIGALYLYFQKKFRYWGERNVPSATPSFPFGNIGDLSRDSFSTFFRNLYEKSRHLKYYGFWQFHRPALLINDPELIKKILVGDFMHFHDHGAYINEKGDPFSGKMKLMFPIMMECGDELIEVLKEPAQRGQVIEAKDYVSRFTTDIISSVAFGIQTNSLKNPDAIFRKMGKKIVEPTWSVVLKNIIGFLLPDVAKILRLVITPKDVSEFFMGVIKETMDYREKNKVNRNDILQLLMELKNKGVIDDVDDPNATEKEKFTFELAAAQAFIFFVAGFETSSTTMQFVLYEMALNTDIQDEVRAEIRQTFKKYGGKMTYESVHEMNLLGRVIDETLRKYPPAGGLSRICTKEYTLPGTDLVIEKDIMLIIPAYGLQMDEQYFPDPEKFDPGRFTEEQKQSRHHYAYLPFGEGPRVCIGQRYALMQIRIGIMTILGNYRIDVAPKETPIPVKFDPKLIILAPKGGMHLKISALAD